MTDWLNLALVLLICASWLIFCCAIGRWLRASRHALERDQHTPEALDAIRVVAEPGKTR